MNVYDFDGTIYDGDSTKDFYIYCLKRNPALLRFIPYQGIAAIEYALRIIDKTKFKEQFYCFFKGIPDINDYLEDFWKSHIYKIKNWYKKQQLPDDVVISASPDFLVRGACDRSEIKYLIASEVNSHTGAYTGRNCRGEEKVSRFRRAFGETAVIDSFYSDDDSDAAVAQISNNAYKVSGDTISDWQL